MKTIKSENFEIHIFFDRLNLSKDKEKFMQNFLSEFDSLNLNYKYRNKLEEVGFSVFGKEGKEIYFESDNSQIDEILETAKDALIDLEKFGNEKTNIFILPTFDKFVNEEMGGITGYCFANNFIFIFMNPKENWKKELIETIAHEFAHSVSPYYPQEEVTLRTCLISEGLAEHFREFVFGGNIAPYSKAISEKKIKKYLEELEKFFESTDENLYSDVFFGTGKYPMWAGYTIGYYLVKKYLETLDMVDWNILLKKDPKKIANLIY